jgi:hypothetical protein
MKDHIDHSMWLAVLNWFDSKITFVQSLERSEGEGSMQAWKLYKRACRQSYLSSIVSASQGFEYQQQGHIGIVKCIVTVCSKRDRPALWREESEMQ